MAFPTTGKLDEFNRLNEGPPPSASWDYPLWDNGAAGGKVISSQLASNVSYFSCWWKTSVGPDSEAFITIATLPDATGDDVLLAARVASPGTAGTGNAGVDGYCIDWVNNAGTDDFYHFRVDNNTFTQLGTTEQPGNMAAGVKLGYSVVGSTLQGYRDTGSGWATFGSAQSDSTYTAAGYIAVSGGDTTCKLDDFGGGTVIPGWGPLLSQRRNRLIGLAA